MSAKILHAAGFRRTRAGKTLKPLRPLFVGAIEDGVPLPRPKNFAGLRKRMRALEPGQSFVTSATKSACYHMAITLKIEVRIRNEGTNIRVWRALPEETE